MYKEKCEEMSPNVQYCLYNIQGSIDTGEVGEDLLSELDEIIAPRASAPSQVGFAQCTLSGTCPLSVTSHYPTANYH